MSESLDDAKYQVAWEQVSRDAEEEASRRFEEFYKSPLLRSAYPPDAIIKLSNGATPLKINLCIKRLDQFIAPLRMIIRLMT